MVLLPNSRSFHLLMLFFLLLLLILHPANSVFFNFSGFHQNAQDIFYQGDALPGSDGVISVTKNQRDVSLARSVGRASYAQPVRLWDARSGKVTDFTTHFSFSINALNASLYGDGLAFFLLPFDQSDIPSNSDGGFLGLFSNATAFTPSENQIVAVEFDSLNNTWDPSSDHVGINVNSIVSEANVMWKSSIKNGSRANAWVSYNSTSHNLSVFLTYAENPIFSGNSSVSHVVNLRDVLPEFVRVGFSAATGDWIELHTIFSWSFSSTLDSGVDGKNAINIGLVVGLAVGIGALSCGLGLFWFIWWRKRADRTKSEVAFDVAIDDEFDKGAGPKRFTFRELSRATSNFAEEGKLGEGGFGGVYKGLLSDTSTEVAVKRFSRGSKQGKKEYVSEVKIISRLRHRNLVQLIGWCHEQGEFLLVYEFMPNGSLDSHLFGGKEASLIWNLRYRIALGIASALLYLHEEWEQCVVHRDIKSSNVMLDSNYNAKLGDFGLARLVDHDLGSQTTVLAGTMGYLAPECVTTGKASKESDVYSFGVVALEITCGRKPVEARAEPSKVRMVEWVWDLYGKGKLLEASDKALTMGFDQHQIECLMIVGLWCCHPDYTLRPSIRQVINVLNFEAPLPNLPSKLPVPMYYAPPMHMCKFSYTTSEGFTDSGRDRTRCSCSSCRTSSTSAGSTKAFLKLHEANV
ncbi:L-type lectin-domain containing receptor kinase IX.1-like [Cornus florida]|uniref:L-type lectin-domain containing receptor kinase IX.1-like n=1 Tax=Cornus florida TaxID=4283 RepID=UPI002898C2B3|nr:L-type lectin-domain containing receptor kinase IX.1-like [Cornus florida]